MQPYESIIKLYRQARQTNSDDPSRHGQLLDLKAPGQVIMTGDLHGHERNFDKIVRFAALAENPQRHLVLHELLHEPRTSAEHCFSFRLLERALRLQKAFPQRVHLLLGNHALCQVFDKPVARAGADAVECLRAGLEQAYGSHARKVSQAMTEFLLSEPLAARLSNRIMLSHSLPSPAKMPRFDPNIIRKDHLNRLDLQRDGSAYLLLWGRRQKSDQLAQLGRDWDVDLFVNGHQPQEMGFSIHVSRQVILASDNSHGCCLPIDLSRTYTAKTLAQSIVKLAAIA